MPNTSVQSESISSNPEEDRNQELAPEDFPPDQPWERRSFWVKTLQMARLRNTWIRVPRLYTEKSAAQLASDLRSSHHRDLKKIRIKGVLPSELWDTRWNASPEGPDGQFAIWIRYLGVQVD